MQRLVSLHAVRDLGNTHIHRSTQAAKIMTARTFGNFWKDQNISDKYHKVRPSVSKVCIEKIIDFVAVKRGSKPSLAVDVGCGTGLSTKLFAPYFSRVIGIDPSPTQVKTACEQYANLANMEFMTGEAEKLPLGINSVDLITCCQSAHWLTYPEAFDEFDRVLVSGGVMALTCYSDPMIVDNTEATAVWKSFDSVLWDSGSWHPRRRWVTNFYSEITMPYDDKLELRNDSETAVRRHVSVDEFFAYLSTISGYINYSKAHDDAEEMLNKYYNAFLACVGAKDGSHVIDVESKNTLLLARKP